MFVLAQVSQSGSNSAIVTFSIYTGLVLFLAWLSSRLIKGKSFLSEYFLGSRNLGVWAFALTFAATSASGGSFIGFPSLVYTHGWSVALWICSYMLMPLVALGLLAKRLNQVARKVGAITIPDLLRERFDSPIFGLIATFLIVFFMTFNLVAQFKGGSVILQTLMSDVPLFQTASVEFAAVARQLPFVSHSVEPSYLLCLCVFAIAVIAYTTYGGFRAVVWTDVLQGLVMVGGIVLLLPMTLMVAGGLSASTRELADSRPPTRVELRLKTNSSWRPTEDSEADAYLAKNTLLEAGAAGDSAKAVYRLAEAVRVRGDGQVRAASDLGLDGETVVRPIQALRLDQDRDMVRHEPVLDGFEVIEPQLHTYAYGAGQRGVYTVGPGPSLSDKSGFLPLSVAISFFFFWCFASAGQPSNMIRCMAFRDSRTLSRAIIMVSIYYTLIYFPIVIIFCCARTILPGWETESDRIMPEVTRVVTAEAGVPWLAGLLIAAPFAAVMSTMDSFLLMISSSVVRDIYQRWLDPTPSERRIKVLTYGTTFTVGFGAMLLAINPPRFLQDIIVFTGAGLATSFLAPVVLALYWPRFNHQGAIAGMLCGFSANLLLYGIGMWKTGQMTAYQPFDLHPFLIGTALSLLASYVVCMITPPPSDTLVYKFFYQRRAENL